MIDEIDSASKDRVQLLLQKSTESTSIASHGNSEMGDRSSHILRFEITHIP